MDKLDREIMHYGLPYGIWTGIDGRQVLFNRQYQPIWQRNKDGDVTRADPLEWVTHDAWEWFYEDKNAPQINKDSYSNCENVLNNWGVTIDLEHVFELMQLHKNKQIAHRPDK